MSSDDGLRACPRTRAGGQSRHEANTVSTYSQQNATPLLTTNTTQDTHTATMPMEGAARRRFPAADREVGEAESKDSLLRPRTGAALGQDRNTEEAMIYEPSWALKAGQEASASSLSMAGAASSADRVLSVRTGSTSATDEPTESEGPPTHSPSIPTTDTRRQTLLTNEPRQHQADGKERPPRFTLPDVREGVHLAAFSQKRPVLKPDELQSTRGLVQPDTIWGGEVPSAAAMRPRGFASLLGEEWVSDNVLNAIFLLICKQEGWGLGNDPPRQGISIWVAPLEMLYIWASRARTAEAKDGETQERSWDFNRRFDGGATGVWSERSRLPATVHRHSLREAARGVRHLFVPMCRQGVHYIFASIDLVCGQIRLHNSFGIRRPGPDSSEQVMRE